MGKDLNDILVEFERRKDEIRAERSIKEMTLFPGKWNEYITWIPKPLGAAWIKRYGPIGKFVLGFANKMFDRELIGSDLEEIDLERAGVDPVAFFDAMTEYFGKEELVSEYVAPCLGMDNPQGQLYIENFFGPSEMIRYFLPAAQAIINEFRADDEEVIEAQKKSEPAEPTEAEE